jgi:hypothetical protein
MRWPTCVPVPHAPLVQGDVQLIGRHFGWAQVEANEPQLLHNLVCTISPL